MSLIIPQKSRSEFRSEVPGALLEEYDKLISSYEIDASDAIEQDLASYTRSDEHRARSFSQGAEFVKEKRQQLLKESFEKCHDKAIDVLSRQHQECFKTFNESIWENGSNEQFTPVKSKRRRVGTPEVMEVNNVDQVEDVNFEDQLNEAYQHINLIQDSISREVNGKISFNRADQVSIGVSLRHIVKNLAQVMLQNQNLQKEVLKSKLEVAETKLENTKRPEVRIERIPEETTPNPRKKSYSEVVQTSPATPEKRTRASGQAREEKVTTTNTKCTYENVNQLRIFPSIKHSIIIGAKQGESATTQELQDRLKDAINLKNIGGGFKSMRANKQGDIVIEAKDEKQKQEVINQLKGVGQMEAKEYVKRLPSIIVTGVESDLTKEEILNEIKSKNEALVNQCSGTFDDQFKITGSKSCRNSKRQNVFVQVSPNMFRSCMKQGKLTIGWTIHAVYEQVRILRCFRCNGYDHILKDCKMKHDMCVHCGGKHKVKECKGSMDCSNCRNLLIHISKRGHPANDIKCPIYLRKLQQLKSNINYGSKPSTN